MPCGRETLLSATQGWKEICVRCYVSIREIIRVLMKLDGYWLLYDCHTYYHDDGMTFYNVDCISCLLPDIYLQSDRRF